MTNENAVSDVTPPVDPTPVKVPDAPAKPKRKKPKKSPTDKAETTYVVGHDGKRVKSTDYVKSHEHVHGYTPKAD